MMGRKRQISRARNIIRVHSVGWGETWALEYFAGMDKGRSRGVFPRVDLFNGGENQDANVARQTMVYLE